MSPARALPAPVRLHDAVPTPRIPVTPARRRTRPVVMLALGAGALLSTGCPAGAAPATPGASTSAAGEARALNLLDSSARAARSRAFSGTQYLASWGAGSASARTVQVLHDPVSGTTVADGSAQHTAALDEQLLQQLADRYALSVVGTQGCSGRTADVVEARRADGGVAARFWVDSETRLPLRHEVWDSSGRPLRSAYFVALQIGADVAEPPTSPVPVLAATAGAGWTPPAVLDGGYALYDASWPAAAGGRVLHLSYSDGLSTISVFSQPGTLGSSPGGGYRREVVGGTVVWVHAGAPERLVWSGGGLVFTVVADAGHDDLRAVVQQLPHDRAASDGPVARLSRGVSRLASWVDPRG